MEDLPQRNEDQALNDRFSTFRRRGKLKGPFDGAIYGSELKLSAEVGAIDGFDSIIHFADQLRRILPLITIASGDSNKDQQ